jgi:hypothetical protein
MQTIDRTIFGDNQFFGINHMSQDKAQAQSERFHDLDAIFDVYRMAFDSGIRAVMLNSNDRAAEICDRFRADKGKLPEIAWYPSIPYPHKYATLVAEKGLVGALQSVIFHDSALGGIGRLMQGGMALVSRDGMQIMRTLVDAEMAMFRGLDVRVVFVQNIVVDLLLGIGVKDFFIDYCDHIRRKYGAKPGFITQNLPALRDALMRWGIRDVVICASVNKIGYLMSPGIAAYEAALAANDPADYQIMAMSTLASGAIPVVEAYDYVNSLNIQSVVFGASSRGNIDQTMKLISGGKAPGQ